MIAIGAVSKYLSYKRHKEITFLVNNLTIVVLAIHIFATCLSVTNAVQSDITDLMLTKEEKHALKQFKQRVEHLLPEDFMRTEFYLIRWLRVSNLDLDLAKERLLNAVQWRLDENIPNILSEDWSDMEQDCRMNFSGVDRQGRPVREMDLGEWDLRALGIQGKAKRVRRYMNYATEKQMHQIFRATANYSGLPVTRGAILIDAEGTNLPQHITCPGCLPGVIRLYTDSEQYYPEFLGYVVIINAPPVSAVVVNAVRPLMPPSVRNRIIAFGANREVWMEYLDRLVDRSQRGERYGGTRKG